MGISPESPITLLLVIWPPEFNVTVLALTTMSPAVPEV
jgi:hypothetical protein